MRTKRNIIYRYKVQGETIYYDISVGTRHVILEEPIPCGLDIKLIDDYINMKAYQIWREEKAKDREKWINSKRDNT